MRFGGDAPDLGMLFAIDDVGLGCLVIGRIQQHPFDDVLDLLHFGRGAQAQFVCQGQDPQGHLFGFPFFKRSCGVAGLGDGCGDLG